VLGALYRSLWETIRPSIARYRDRPGGLPSHLDRADLAQESWLMLAELARRWDPAGGEFGAYVRVSFPWQLANYVRDQSPSRRRRGLRVVAADRPDVQEQVEAQPGVDGRDWDVDIAWSELLEHLTPDERAVLMLHFDQEQPFSHIARALRITRPSVVRLYRRAMERVRAPVVRVGRRRVVVDVRGRRLEHAGDLVEVVRALHRGADSKGRLPSRAWLVDQTGLGPRRIARLVDLLAEAGCIRGRRGRFPGRLAYRTPEAMLAALGIEPDTFTPSLPPHNL
jgi:RNA polymerase sigma factor (sigma-70 family)